jgi:ADP-ribose pyrophosphatase YjhB (NUDIX family)
VELRLRCPGQQQQQQQAANDTVAAASAVAAVEPADAVLILAVTTAVTAAMNACTGSGAAGAEPRLIFVKHERRGWELPGGKVDPGEEETQAVLRELKEEAGARWRAVGAPVPLVEYLITEDIERTDSDIAASTASDGPQGRSFGVGVRLGAVGTHLKRVYTVCVEPVESDEALEAETAAVATAPLLLLHPEHLRQSGVSPLLGDQVAAVALRMLQALHYAALRSASGHPTGRE